MAKICDLGVARVNSDGKGLVFSASVRAGTPSYMAPELLHGKLERITRKVWGVLNNPSLRHMTSITLLIFPNS